MSDAIRYAEGIPAAQRRKVIAYRTTLEHILAWPIERVLITHGEPPTANGASCVENAFAWLLGEVFLDYEG